MIRMAFIDDVPLVGELCEKLLLKNGALERGDCFDKFTNSKAFMEAFRYRHANHYDLVIADHHLEENEDTKGYDLLLHIQLAGYAGPAILYSSDKSALMDISMIVSNHTISLLEKDSPGNTSSIDHIAKIIYKIKGLEWRQ